MQGWVFRCSSCGNRQASYDYYSSFRNCKVGHSGTVSLLSCTSYMQQDPFLKNCIK